MRSPRSVTRVLAMLFGIAASGLVACAEPLTEIVVVVDSAGSVVVVASTVGLPTVSVKVPELAKL